MKILRHPAWLICFLLFVGHQIAQKMMAWEFRWADHYLDDLLCMPIFLSFVLIERRFLLKNPLFVFSFFETMVMVLALGIVFEEGFPRWSDQFTHDYWDYFYYCLGGLFFYFLINSNDSRY